MRFRGEDERPQFRSQWGDAVSSTQPAWEQVPQSIARIGCCVSPHRRNFHLFQPLLYQVAAAALSPGDIAWPVRSVFARQKNVRVMMMDFNAVHTAVRTVSKGVTTLAYDFLVCRDRCHACLSRSSGLGAVPPQASRQSTMPVPCASDCCLLAERSESDELRQRCLTPVIIGGATGFEMAGAVAELSQRPASANPTTYGSNCCSSF
jgi:NADH dehydrogenase